MRNSYNSIYGSHIKQFIEIKKKLGFKFYSGTLYLSKIDLLAQERSETSIGITKEFAEQWCKKGANEKENSRYNRIGFLIKFSSYLCELGIQSHIPKLPPFTKSNFIPYIYSKTEIDALFIACDELRIKSMATRSILLCMPTLLRLLYCTGIRISEALVLKNNDVNLEDNYLQIRDSKNGKERIIPFSDSLTTVCKEYVWHKNKLPFIQKKTDFFFINFNGMKCSSLSVNLLFKKCLHSTGIPQGKTQTPRIHDLRHTFAVTSLANMAESGIDLYVSLPILSNYLGHQSIESTNHYVRLTASMYPDLIKQTDTICIDVFPKYRNYEAN